MADNQPRCYFEIDDDTVCMELVAALGHRCAAHTFVPLVRIPLVIPPNFEEVNPPEPPPVLRVRQPQPDHMRCTGIKQNGERCFSKRKDGTERCGRHPEVAAVVGGICTGVKTNGLRCTSRAGEGGLCGTHFRSNATRLRKESATEWLPYDIAAINQILHDTRDQFRRLNRALARMAHMIDTGPQPPDFLATYEQTGNQVLALRLLLNTRKAGVITHLKAFPPERLLDSIEECSARSRVRVRVAMQQHIDGAEVVQQRRAAVEALRRLRNENLDNQLELERIQRGVQGVQIPHRFANNIVPDNPLARFAHDRQNVHTPETSTMVRDATIRLAVAVPADNVLQEISRSWFDHSLGTPQMRNMVRADMTDWYERAWVRVDGDFAYKHMLDRVWGLIKASRHREDMEKRLWEEALDSVGMCADGHLTRLANSLQGFDEADAPVLEVPLSERLQTAMSQISEMDPGERESAARRVFAELGVEGDAQRPWLEALEA